MINNGYLMLWFNYLIIVKPWLLFLRVILPALDHNSVTGVCWSLSPGHIYHFIPRHQVGEYTPWKGHKSILESPFKLNMNAFGLWERTRVPSQKPVQTCKLQTESHRFDWDSNQGRWDNSPTHQVASNFRSFLHFMLRSNPGTLKTAPSTNF